jgi:hypothetical protein
MEVFSYERITSMVVDWVKKFINEMIVFQSSDPQRDEQGGRRGRGGGGRVSSCLSHSLSGGGRWQGEQKE